MQQGAETGAHIAAIETRVGALEQGIISLQANTDRQFAAVMSKLDERGRTQWPVLISSGMLILGVLSTLGFAFWSPVNATLQRLDAGLETKLGRDESQMWSKLRDEQFSRRDERDTSVERRLQKLETKVFGL